MKMSMVFLAVVLLTIACRDDQPGWTLVAGGYEFPEGPAWDGEKALYVSNCRGDWMGRIEGDVSQVFLRRQDPATGFHTTNGLTVGRQGFIYACDFGIGAILRLAPTGESEIIADGFQGERFRRPNDLAFDPQGNLYFSDPNRYGAEEPDGVVYRIDRLDRQVTPAATGLDFPNGLAFSADGRQLFVCESGKQRILVFDLGDDGELTNQRVFAELPGGDPDGINFDLQGNLYVAHFGGGAVIVLAPDGSVRRVIPTPGKKPSNVEFGNSDRKTLYVTEVETNSVYSIRVPVAGLPLLQGF
ncbi:MAG TPA: SMP-30/gluconolactonase/LRE family protein [bacterium]|nr:SMP-30/gluconolactonase/LRE family protein [bacterium]